MLDSLANPLWDFALEIYDRPGISDAFLTLQDEAEVDVVGLITVLYASVELHAPLTTYEIHELRKVMEGWRVAVVLPLRAVRRSLKAFMLGIPEEMEHLRVRVKADELMAEKIQLALAHRWLGYRPLSVGLSLNKAVVGLLAANRRNRHVDAAVSAILTIVEARTASR